MGGINIGRWLAGGVVAGALIWMVEWLAGAVYAEDMQAVLEAHGLAVRMSPEIVILSLAGSVILGLALVFFYAMARPRLGPGPRTAGTVAVPLWMGAYVVSLIGNQMLGLFPGKMLALWAAVGFVEMVLAAVVGGWISREKALGASAGSL